MNLEGTQETQDAKNTLTKYSLPLFLQLNTFRLNRGQKYINLIYSLYEKDLYLGF